MPPTLVNVAIPEWFDGPKALNVDVIPDVPTDKVLPFDKVVLPPNNEVPPATFKAYPVPPVVDVGAPAIYIVEAVPVNVVGTVVGELK